MGNDSNKVLWGLLLVLAGAGSLSQNKKGMHMKGNPEMFYADLLIEEWRIQKASRLQRCLSRVLRELECGTLLS